MRYPKPHKNETRERILRAAATRLREQGAYSESIANLMKSAGMTHGGFYAHFESREALVGEVVLVAMEQTNSRLLRLVAGKSRSMGLRAIVRAYLNRSHRKNAGRGCALPALGGDLGRSSDATRENFSRKFEEMIEIVILQLPDAGTKATRQKAIAAIATMVGSLIVARATSDNELADEILIAGRRALLGQEYRS